ncbi:MAG: hypothetical protein AAF404_10775 [Pseudomonadota bacterium]
MEQQTKQSVWAVVAITGALWLSGCGGSSSGARVEPTSEPFVQTAVDVSDASIIAAATKNSGGQINASGSDYSLPAVTNDNGSMSMTIPAGPPPEIPARRTVASGGGATLNFGDPVILKYDMFSWSDGTLVDSSAQYDEAYTVKSGVSDEIPIPEYLAKSLPGRSLGDTLQVILPVGTQDLPAELDQQDAYILIVTLL